MCQSIDPAPVWWQKELLEASDAWERFGMDIAHYGDNHFLTNRFCDLATTGIARLGKCSLTAIIHLYEQGTLEEILSDNDTAFCSQQVWQFLSNYGRNVHMYHQVMVSQKEVTTVSRGLLLGSSALLWRHYTGTINIMPKDGVSPVTAPANASYTYWVWAKRIDVMQPSDNEEVCGLYAMGDSIWIKPPGSWCTTRFKRGQVTCVVSQQSVLVNRIPCHVRDLLPALETGHSVTEESDELSGDVLLMNGANGPPENVTASSSDDSEAETVEHIPLWRSTWIKRPHLPCFICDQEISGECSRHHANPWQKRMRVTLSRLSERETQNFPPPLLIGFGIMSLSAQMGRLWPQ